ncbi:hypothetical protein EC968_003263 [Mortierella alpina]|nr:hypothetical protein EC968_003263 [Mortierella alpina]
MALIALQVVGSDSSADYSNLSTASTAAVGTEDKSGRVYRWIAIGCGAVVNIILGGYAGLTHILETEGRWTQRLQFVKDESKWWAGMSIIILVAFSMDVVAFSKGESVDATILLLAAEVGIEPDLTTVSMASTMKEKQQQPQPVARFESNVDIPGYGTMLSRKIKYDLITVLKQRAAQTTTTGNNKTIITNNVFTDIGSVPPLMTFVYPPHQVDQTQVSILWGGENCDLFSRRVSRGITAYTLDRIQSSYSVISVDESKWMFVAGGIVARNKGLEPARLICGLTTATTTSTASTNVGGGTELRDVSIVAATTPAPSAVATTGMTLNLEIVAEVERTSKWRPRQAKTSRTRYTQESRAQFSGLGQPYCTAVVEIALLMQDLPNLVLIRALQASIEQQSCEKMWRIHLLFDRNSDTRSSCIVIQDAMYVCQYMTLCAKLNWYGKNDERPDLIMGLMYMTYKRLDCSFDGVNEEILSDILQKELLGLDQGVVDGNADDMLVCLGAYLGIEASLRKQVITDLSSKFVTNGAVQKVLSGDLSPPAVHSTGEVHVNVSSISERT